MIECYILKCHTRGDSNLRKKKIMIIGCCFIALCHSDLTKITPVLSISLPKYYAK